MGREKMSRIAIIARPDLRTARSPAGRAVGLTVGPDATGVGTATLRRPFVSCHRHDANTVTRCQTALNAFHEPAQP
jgi:hypothetical protein